MYMNDTRPSLPGRGLLSVVDAKVKTFENDHVLFPQNKLIWVDFKRKKKRFHCICVTHSFYKNKLRCHYSAACLQHIFFNHSYIF